ncbi:hypothetical protein HX049_07935 [Myroides odoratimimus]|uniref:hypothetical protein n=1 Tax=Myroides odoratimimus TaxID=76832 RepID=UPI0025791F11|nr:hypothetical protein [Myroides odoratimimus]MDM1397103.1 hypothetical protein [Myroides odoratimimus]
MVTKIYECDTYRFRVFIDFGDKSVSEGYHQLSKNTIKFKKFWVVVVAVKEGSSTKEQFNYEGNCDGGKIFAIKVNQDRFYGVMSSHDNYRVFVISKFLKKETQKNDKKIKQVLTTISLPEFE